MRSMTGTNLCMLDSNVLVYAFEAAESLKHQSASELLENIVEGKVKAALSTQILSEFFVNVTAEKKHSVVATPLSVEEAGEIISELTSLPELEIFGIKVNNVLDALEIKKSSKASYWDCLIASVMKEHGITTIYTEDKAFEKIEGIKVINPFVNQPT